MRYIQRQWRAFRAFLLRVFAKAPLGDIRKLVKLQRTAKCQSERLMDFSEIEKFARFFSHHEETLTVILNKLVLEYNDSARSFYDVLSQAKSDFDYLSKQKEVLSKKSLTGSKKNK